MTLADVADIKLVSGASFIYREQQERYVPIKFSVRGRDLGTTVLDAQHRIEQQVTLPGGYRLEWVGEFGNLQEALGRLEIVVPLAILLPDLSAIGYLRGTRVGARVYNLFHITALPGALVAIGWSQNLSLASALALIWLAHIGMDRVLGYGLKYDDDFQHTHLSRQ